MHQNIFVFDIETIPDIEASHNLTSCNSNNVQELREALTNYHLEITDGKNPFHRQLFHKIVAVSFLEAEINYSADGETYHLTNIRSGGTESSDEKELVKGFFSYIEKKKARLVSFNGRGFDLPVLKYRAMKHNISAKYLYQSGDKWNNYMQRYSSDWHCDLMDVLSDYGTSAKIKLNEICSILNLPGKIGVDGSQVSTLYDNNKIKMIRDYCETDVLNTYLVYVYYQHHIGKINENSFKKAINDCKEFLQNSKQEHFLEFYNEWEKVSQNNFILESA